MACPSPLSGRGRRRLLQGSRSRSYPAREAWPVSFMRVFLWSSPDHFRFFPRQSLDLQQESQTPHPLLPNAFLAHPGPLAHHSPLPTPDYRRAGSVPATDSGSGSASRYRPCILFLPVPISTFYRFSTIFEVRAPITWAPARLYASSIHDLSRPLDSRMSVSTPMVLDPGVRREPRL